MPPPATPPSSSSSTSFPARRNSRNLLMASSQTTLPSPPQFTTASLLPPVPQSPLRSPRNPNRAPAPPLPGSLTPRSSSSLQQPPTAADGPPRYYLVGTRLDSRIPTWNRMYAGRVAAVNLDGTLQICYDDGDLRDGISLANVCFETRPSPLSEMPQLCALHPGYQVEYSLEAATWIPAKVTEVVAAATAGGGGEVTYHLGLCTGRPALNVPRSHIRLYIPPPTALRAQEVVEVLFPDTRTWSLGRVDESAQRVIVSAATTTSFAVSEVELRYPIPLALPPPPQPPQDEDEFLDATPMLLSMQERVSQSIEVGAQVLITDKNGGALPKTGKADSAQVSIINFPLPADGLIESITLRLFEAPAEEASQLEVMLFDREPVVVVPPPPLPQADNNNNAVRRQEDQQPTPTPLGAPAPAPVAAVTTPPPPKVYVSPDLPYRVSRSFIQIDPHSRQVQCCKLVVPLRGSAGQYLGIMNRHGRLNIAYTPDKKKPGESWSEKSVEVFYLMPRMVPKSFVGGPYTTREWHGRAGWFATMLVVDPVEEVDPAFLRRCELYALNKDSGAAELAKLCWLLTSLLRIRGQAFADQLLYRTPAVVRALRMLCLVNDSVVELVSRLCAQASVRAKPPGALFKLQSALRFKAAEMQIVQQGRHHVAGEATASFQRLLKCLLSMKRLLPSAADANAVAAAVSTAPLPQQPATPKTPRALPPLPQHYHLDSAAAAAATRILLPPQPASDTAPFIRYELKLNGRLAASSSSTPLLVLPPPPPPPSSTSSVSSSGTRFYELSLVAGQDDAFQLLLQTTGPIQSSSTSDLYFPTSLTKQKELWDTWTSPVELVFHVRQGNSSSSSTGAATASTAASGGDWLDDLERCTLLLHAFARRDLAAAKPDLPASFVREQYFQWRRQQERRTITLDGLAKAEIAVPGANRLRLEWIRAPHLESGSTLTLTNQRGVSVSGRNGLPPPVEVVEGSAFTVMLSPQRAEFDPEFLLHQSLEAERAEFQLALGLTNCQGEPAKIRAAGGELQMACTRCGAGGCREEPVCNVEGRPVTLHRTRFSCSECETLPVPCQACALFPDSLAARKSIRVRPKSSFDSVDKYEQYIKRALVPGAPVRVMVAGDGGGGRGGGGGSGEVRRFLRFNAHTQVCWLRGNAAPNMCELADLQLVDAPTPSTDAAVVAMAVSPAPVALSSSASTTASASASSLPGTFASGDLGPDIELSADGLTCTRLRSVGWGTQRLATFIEHGLVTVTLKIVRNASNHLFFGVVAPGFASDWSKRLTEPGAWAIRRDGTLHANGREHRATADSAQQQQLDAPLGNGEELTMVIDLTGPLPEDRSITFTCNQIELGRLVGLPARVVPAVSFGGSNQIVSISAYSHIGGGGAVVGRLAPPTPPITSHVLVPGGTATMQSTTTTEEDDGSGRFRLETTGALEILPEFDHVSLEQEQAYLATAHATWTSKQDRLLVCHVDQIAHEQRLSFAQLLLPQQADSVLFAQRAGLRTPAATRPLQLLLEEQPLHAVQQRLEWIVAFNRSVAQALPLLDLSFDDAADADDATSTSATAEHSVARDLGECSYLLFDALKRPMWEEALETTRTEEGQFEVVLDFGKALAHRDFVDVHGRFTVFAQAFRVMNAMPASRLRGKGQLYRATLRGMRAHDDGGPYRQSMATYCEELMSTPGVGLFLPCANRTNEIALNRDRWLPNPGCTSAVQFQMFEFVGKLMGIALRNREFLNLRLPTLVWRWLVNGRPTFEDLRAVDLLFANRVGELLASSSKPQQPQQPQQSRRTGSVDYVGAADVEVSSGGDSDDDDDEEYDAYAHHHDDDDEGEEDEEDDMMMNFTCYSLDGRVIELVPKGSERVLQNTAQDRREWALLATKYKLGEFNPQLEAMRRGLHSVVPQRMLMLFQVDELELMVCGRPVIDLQLLREMTVYVGCTVHDAHIAYFWNVLQGFSHEQRSLYLKFVFGRSTLPSREAWGAPHKISSFETRSMADTDTLLPRSHTCYFSLDLPKYSSEEVLRRKLLFAIENCTEIDADQTTTGNRSAALGFDLNLDLDELVEVERNLDQLVLRQQQQQQQSGGGGGAQAPPRPVSPATVALAAATSFPFGSFSSRTSERSISSRRARGSSFASEDDAAAAGAGGGAATTYDMEDVDDDDYEEEEEDEEDEEGGAGMVEAWEAGIAASLLTGYPDFRAPSLDAAAATITNLALIDFDQ